MRTEPLFIAVAALIACTAAAVPARADAAAETPQTPAVLKEGMPAPTFTLVSDRGDTVSLGSYLGKQRVVVYFYPKDMTPGCTAEACSFRDHTADLQEHGAVVLGVNPGDRESHAEFVAKEKLNFPLLVDPDARVAKAYGVWKERKPGDPSSMGIERSTFLIDERGIIRHIWRGVKVQGHDAEVLAALTTLKK